MSSTVIVPCAGKSSRFNTTRPKWMLTHPNGNLMFMQSISGLSNIDNVVVVFVKEHINKYNVNIDQVYRDINLTTKTEFLILDDFTLSQSDTVNQAIEKMKITGPIFIKDCDNYFNANIDSENCVCISSLDMNTNAINKSYVKLDKLGYLSGIIEKQVISDKFCVGGYSFNDALAFSQTFKELSNMNNININEIYISHVIQKMLLDNKTFSVKHVNNYCDWGTINDWNKYTSQYKTLFVDLDGTLVFNSSSYFNPGTGQSAGLPKNISLINKLYDTGKVKIIITTARKEGPETYHQLDSLNIKYHQIIFNLPHAQRILINDYSSTNPFPSASAICISRNADNLEDFLS